MDVKWKNCFLYRNANGCQMEKLFYPAWSVESVNWRYPGTRGTGNVASNAGPVFVKRCALALVGAISGCRFAGGQISTARHLWKVSIRVPIATPGRAGNC
eukprot:1147622-Rhodomonas_salina.1